MNNKQLATRLKDLINQLNQILADIPETEVTPQMEEAKHLVNADVCPFCKKPHDDYTKIFRGAHERCYRTIKRSIQSKEVTEIQAIRRGWMLPIGILGQKRRANDPIAIALAEKSTKPQRKK